jgi:hypothetical protein
LTQPVSGIAYKHDHSLTPRAIKLAQCDGRDIRRTSQNHRDCLAAASVTEPEGGDESSSLRRADSRLSRELLRERARERIEGTKVGEKLPGDVQRALASSTVAKDERDQFAIRQSAGAKRAQPLTRTLAFGEILDREMHLQER